ncbi:tetratricopeptide repeat protein [uncultured Prevotella sp.]|uniref:tetratricopeptide repeat protein n=1 Tax=uncultured Prevotella sp. TaxID=159272 RepID=UPI0026143936|nr:tetratricopeptide repeat protein [uncultured Prevotella sp.]
MIIRRHCYILAVAAAALLAACGTGRTGTKVTARDGSASAPKETTAGDTLDYNTKLRLRYFYEEAANQQALGKYDVAYELLQHCKNIAPDAAEVYFALSSYDRDLNSNAMAINDIKRAAELSPENSTYQEQLAMTYIATKDYPNAIKAYEKLYSSNPDRTDVLEILLSLYGQKKDYANMLATVDRMVSADGESEQTVLTRMHIYSLQGKKKEEFNTLKRFVDRYPNDMSYQVMMSNWLLQNGEKQKAFDILQKVQKTDPQNVQAKLSMIDYYRAENLDSIARKMEEGLLTNPHTSTDTKVSIIRSVIANNEASGGDSTKVLSLFRNILAGKQENADLAELYVAYLSLKKMPEDSIVGGLKRILEIAPDNKGARIELLRTLWGKIGNDEIIEISKPGVEYNPDEMAFYYFLGFAYIQKDDDDNAFDIFRKGVAQATDSSEPSLVSGMYSYIGDIYHQRGQIEEAYAAFDSCLQWKEDNVECMNNYAYFISVDGGDLSRAEQMSYKTIKAQPTNSLYLDTYAWVLFQEKRYAEAQIYIEQAVANDSTNSYVQLEHAGDIYIMLGETDKAIDYWRRAIQAGGDAKAIERKIRLKKYIP